MLKPKFKADNRAALAARMDQIPDDLYVTCPYCQATFYHQRLTDNRECPHCGYGFRLSARQRLAMLTDQFTEMDAQMARMVADLDPDYQRKYQKAQAAAGEPESVVTGIATIAGQRTAVGVMDAHFMMGSLGQITGEKLTRLFETATRQQLPVVLYTASGGARMQEGLRALMQMAKVTQAVADHDDAGLLFVVVLTDPTTGGVTASFAMEGDITLAEPHALIGFTGQRVIEQTLHVTTPPDFQRAETLAKNGFIDAIVPRGEQRQRLGTILKMHESRCADDGRI